MWAGEGMRERETQAAPGSELSAQSLSWVPKPQTLRSWPDLSWSQTPNWLSHPGAPTWYQKRLKKKTLPKLFLKLVMFDCLGVGGRISVLGVDSKTPAPNSCQNRKDHTHLSSEFPPWPVSPAPKLGPTIPCSVSVDYRTTGQLEKKDPWRRSLSKTERK